ncbi:hypothetical protein Clacol_001621 [Clathrus columnatus]|uniref:Uncharacterized protein n=1 Tax=Clathrus columnatus TaxID=1419009 RepID=A0AAV5A3U1_9AGAM|nr:hypothetical protein Clacol_001621 [Clathrus columnatus]
MGSQFGCMQVFYGDSSIIGPAAKNGRWKDSSERDMSRIGNVLAHTYRLYPK